MLAANPGFTTVAILSLAIGIGANTSMFSLVDALLLRPLPVPHSSQIVRVLSTSPSNRFEAISYQDYLDFRDHAQAVSGLLASYAVPIGFAKDSKSLAQPKLGLGVSPNFFDVLEVQPTLGRAFRADEDRRQVVILSDFLWQSEFNRDPSVIGSTVSLSKMDFTVIGIAPKSFTSLELFIHEDFYVPMGTLALFGSRLATDLQQRDQL